MRTQLIVGTRPEAIKMAPLALALRRHGVDTEIINTGQHQQVLDEALAMFGLVADHNLNIFEHGQSLNSISAKTLLAVDALLAHGETDALVVQGDTNSAAAAGIAANYRGVPLIHLEAGLRTGDKKNPFPEEINRLILGSTADLHLAPTSTARQNLLNEGVHPEAVIVTGNTVVDAARIITSDMGKPMTAALAAHFQRGLRTVLATTHRRESWGEKMAAALEAIGEVIEGVPDTQLLLASHPNPAVQATVRQTLGGRSRVHIIPPLAYPDFMHALRQAHLVVTDSGGVQEEAPSFGKPVLVLRETTERPEGVNAGVARLVGTDPAKIRGSLSELLASDGAYSKMARSVNPYGDGLAGERAARAIMWFTGQQTDKPEEFEQ